MPDERPSTVDQPAPNAGIRELIDAYGVTFDGAIWLMVEAMDHPEKEVFFVTSVSRETVALTQNKMALGMALVETFFGFVLQMKITFTDHEVNPTVVESFLNPATAEVRRWLQMLGRQELCYVISMDHNTGEEFKTTRLPIPPEFRVGARQALAMTSEEAEPDDDRWQAALASFHEHTDAPSGHVRLRPEAPSFKAGRNEPCPCGSGKKFKHCHGA